MLLATKLFIPTVRTQVVARQRLLDQLTAALAGKLTLIAAPAGFGKTTLTAVFTTTTNRPTAWLSLDSADNDPARFFTYLLTALQTVQPTLGQTAQTLLQAPGTPPQMVLTAVLNDLAQLEEPMLLVLDDYHAISNEQIHEALSFFVEHLPPTIHLIITSRTVPPFALSRLRARGQLTEIRARDLRFTLTEATTFFQQTTVVSLTDEQIATLEARTEGWATGLQLAALSLQQQPDLDQFIAQFGGSHHYVLDYLVDEVIRQQPAGIEDFLLKTAVLDRFCAPLCDEVLEIRDWDLEMAPIPNLHSPISSQPILQHLANANLFLVPLDNERNWYRYHHLFADFLRARLRTRRTETEIQQLHQRAARWYEVNGFRNEAIEHGLAAADYETAAGRIVQLADSLWTRGELHTLETWLDKLPDGMETAVPQTSLYKAWCLFLVGQYAPDGAPMLAEAGTLLERAEQIMAQQETSPSTWEMVYGMQTAVVSLQQDLPRTIALGEKTLAQQSDQVTIWRGVAMVSLGVAQRYIGQLAAATNTFATAAQLCQASHNLYGAIYAYDNLAELLVEQGQLRSAYRAYEDGLRTAAAFRAEQLPIVGQLHIGLGQLLWEWNKQQQAQEKLEVGIALYATGGFPVLEAQLMIAAIYAQQGNQEKSEALCELVAEAIANSHYTPQILASAQRALAEFGWRQGQLARADKWRRQTRLNLAEKPSPWQAANYLLLARLTNNKEAVAGLMQLREMMGKNGRLDSQLRHTVGLAMIQLANGDAASAYRHLTEAIQLAEPDGYQQLFLVEGQPMANALRQLYGQQKRQKLFTPPQLAHIGTILRAFLGGGETAVSSSPTQATPHPLIEPLSEREREILQLIVAGHSNQAIADQLVVALSTIKWHINNIYGKLDVRTRPQAIASAIQLGLVD
ncbi:MAG: LuxR C-terminal-related transcriptional regulator [Chloroflexota bacterium]